LHLGNDARLPDSNRTATAAREGLDNTPHERSPAMTIRVPTPTHPHTGPQQVHTFSLPVVRELPQVPSEPAGDRAW
jgi:hypothetical protein